MSPPMFHQFQHGKHWQFRVHKNILFPSALVNTGDHAQVANKKVRSF